MDHCSQFPRHRDGVVARCGTIPTDDDRLLRRRWASWRDKSSSTVNDHERRCAGTRNRYLARTPIGNSRPQIQRLRIVVGESQTSWLRVVRVLHRDGEVIRRQQWGDGE